MRLIYAAMSDIGLVRGQNEDSFLVAPGVFAVCDGMGGAQAGEVASEVACRHLMDLCSGERSVERLVDAVRRANEEIVSRSLAEPDLAGMGTTLTAAIQEDDTLVFAHVGDSRAYLFHGGSLRQLTEDHSLVAELVRQGRLTPEQAAIHPHRSVITRALGTEWEIHPDVFRVPLAPGDRVLICTDGVSGLVPDDRIGLLMAQASDPEEAARSLVQEAIARGGDDNATAVVIFALGDEGGSILEAEGEIKVGPERRLRNGLAQRSLWVSRRVGPGFRGWLSRLRLRRRYVVAALVAFLILGLGVGGFAIFNASVYYVGTEGDYVVLYRGLPATVCGVRLYRPVERAAVLYSSLKPYQQQRVDAHELRSREEGEQFLRSLDSPD